MLNGKILTEYINLFCSYDFKKNDDIIMAILKMNNYIDIISKINLSDQTKIWLCEIIGIENYFCREINEKKSYVKKLNKHITIFEYTDKILIILSATSGVVSIISLLLLLVWQLEL